LHNYILYAFLSETQASVSASPIYFLDTGWMIAGSSPGKG